ncbi:Chloroperoxidase [Desarmillaria tabescens]|uniref:Chloroperoxidase n=1 Tax=Armillaria tabescens TaxID=1929756 RepID=A0AA39N358_ARMTA|nr:Chloroperoxidase [Desarmillaria tabescens]KAK0455674.1 Chloroperoxidase [Desarmillaria tabescens]
MSDTKSYPLEKCPVTGHEYRPPQPGDSRSVCPALNTMANHGYIPRDGKNLTIPTIVSGLKACYGLSTGLAAFLTIGGFLWISKLFSIDLFDIGRHGRVEHNASLVHADTPEGEIYAPTKIHEDWVEEVNAGKVSRVDAEDVARMRVRREKTSPVMDALHAEVARGEMALILGIWEQKGEAKTGVPLPWLLDWLGNERLPERWTPDHKQTLSDTVARSKGIRLWMEKIRG